MNKARILNLADIHFDHKPQNENKFREKYFKSIRNQIDIIKPTHIIINGDMVFDAKLEQYTECFNSYISEYFSENLKTRLILTPGNHSCDREYPFQMIDKHKLTKERVVIKKGSKKGEKRALNKKELYNIIEKKEKCVLEDFLFKHYSCFVNDVVISRFKLINKDEQIMEYETYKKSKGLYGVIYDKEFDLIFGCLNSSSYCWGVKSFKKMTLKEIDKTVIEDYGNLSFRNSAKAVKEDLKKLKKRSLLNSSVVVLLSHHPLSWASWESRYRKKNVNYIFKKSDIVLNGHEHVGYKKPSKHNNSTYIFKSAQLYSKDFDYHGKGNHYDSEKFKDVITKNFDTLGFSHLSFSEFNKFYVESFFLEKPEIKISKESKLKVFKSSLFNWKRFEKSYKIRKKKVFVDSCFSWVESEKGKSFINFLGEDKFYNYISGVSKPLNTKTTQTISSINDSFCINIDEYLQYNYKNGVVVKGVSNYDEIIPFIYDEKMICFINIKKRRSAVDIFNLLKKYILSLALSKPNSTIQGIEFMFFDFNLYYIFGKLVDMSNYDNLYQELTGYLSKWARKTKNAIFNDNISEAELVSLSNISIGFNIIKLKQYKKSIKRTK